MIIIHLKNSEKHRHVHGYKWLVNMHIFIYLIMKLRDDQTINMQSNMQITLSYIIMSSNSKIGIRRIKIVVLN